MQELNSSCSVKSKVFYSLHGRGMVAFCSFCLVMCSLLAGCGSSSEGIVPVSGVVTYQGKLVPEGQIVFYPVGGGRPSSGEIQSDGSYTLTCYDEDDGAAMGRHRVTVTAFTTDEKTTDDFFGSGKPVKRVWLVPEKYSRRESTTLQVEVETGSEKIDFDLD